MAIILKRNAEIRDYKIQLENMLNDVNENINNPDYTYYELESLNNSFEKFANIMRPSLNELVKTELLQELENQVDYANKNEEFEEMDSYSFGQKIFQDRVDGEKIFQDHVKGLSLYEGYYIHTTDNENALKGVEYHGGDLYEYVSEAAKEDFENLNKIPNESEKFAAYRQYAIPEVFTEYAKDVESSEYDENYFIDVDNITLADVMVIHNAISDELGEERIYSKEEILKELKKDDMDLENDIDM